MTGANPNQQNAGRSYADAAVEIFRMLGSAAPYVLILAGALFAFYQFQDQSRANSDALRKAQEEASRHFDDQLKAINKALIDTYAQIGTMSAVQIKNVNDLLEVHGKVTKSTHDLQTSTEQLRQKMEDARQAASLAYSTKEAAEKEREAASARAQAAAAELKALEEILKSKRENLKSSADQVGIMRNRLIELAGAIMDDIPNPIAPSRLLAARIVEEFSTSSAQILSKSDLAKDAGEQAMKALLGRPEADLIQVIQNSSGYVAWLRMAQHSGRDSTRYLGVGAKDADQFRQIVVIEVDAGKVVSIGTRSDWFGVMLPREDNWYQRRPMIVLRGDNATNYYWPGATGSPDWGLEDLSGSAEVRVVKGDLGRVKYLTMQEFTERFPTEYQSFADSDDADTMPYVNVRMPLLHKAFNVSRVIPDSAINLTPELKSAVASLFAAALAEREDDGRDYLALSPAKEWLGRVAAMTLKKDFRFVSAQPRPSSDKGAQSTAAAVSVAFSYVGGAKLSLMRSNQSAPAPSVASLGDPTLTRVDFVFDRPEGSDKWRLTELIETPRPNLSRLVSRGGAP